MRAFFGYIFWPNPAGWHYGDTKVQLVLGACVALILFTFVLRYWRSRIKNPMTRTLSSGWPTAAFSFGVVALVLAVSRVEQIQFVSMRFLWILWALVLGLYLLAQVIMFRRRHYVIIEKQYEVSVVEKYLPKRKR